MRLWRRRTRQAATPSGLHGDAASPLLPGLKTVLDALLDEEDPEDAIFTPAQESARENAANNFRASGPELLAQATLYLWQYYESVANKFTPEQCREYGIPLLPPETDIWTQVSIVVAPSIEVGNPPYAPADAYISFEGEVSWEPEHGLQLVIENGQRICKVGPYNGHVTNAHAHGDLSRLAVVFDQ